ncbi:Carbohydrate-selective porin OprB [Calothrix sp. PCC 6303]|nr:Carbohydrate-selective porin OprB [Calothrix sp. PCC 6303]
MGVAVSGQSPIAEIHSSKAISLEEPEKKFVAAQVNDAISSDKITPPEFAMGENNLQPITSPLKIEHQNILKTSTPPNLKNHLQQNQSKADTEVEKKILLSPSTKLASSEPKTQEESKVDLSASVSLLGDREENTESESDASMSQVTSVSQLEDVKPADWAFAALQSLVERYGCIAGFPDGKFKGDRAMNRYEFAAGLDGCLQKVSELVANNTENAVKQEDLAVLQRLQAEFTDELATVKAKLSSLEGRSAQVQENLFSTTTKLYGQAIMSVQGTNASNQYLFPGDQKRAAQTNPTFAYSTQLTFATTFTGRDLLLTGLSAGNLKPFTQSTFTNMGRLGFESDSDSNVSLNELSYRFPVNENLGVVIGTAGVNPVNVFRGISPLEGSGEGSISLFGQRNPILSVGGGSSGIGVDWQLSDRISLQGVYSAEIPFFPGDINIGGLFGGRYTAGAQLTATPTDNIDVGIHYLFSHAPDDNLRTGIGDTQLTSPFVPNIPFDTHAVGATVGWRVNPNLHLGGWGGWTYSEPTSNISGNVQTTNWAVFAALPNLFRPGNMGGIIVGQPPKISSSTLPDGYNLPNFAIPDFQTGGGKGGREDTSLHVEAFYRAQLTDNIAITPGILAVFNPNHNDEGDTLIVAALRATFRF